MAPPPGVSLWKAICAGGGVNRMPNGYFRWLEMIEKMARLSRVDPYRMASGVCRRSRSERRLWQGARKLGMNSITLLVGWRARWTRQL